MCLWCSLGIWSVASPTELSHRTKCWCLLCCLDQSTALWSGLWTLLQFGSHGSLLNYSFVVCSVGVFWEYVPVFLLSSSCLCCRWIGRCQCFVYFSKYQWNKKPNFPTEESFVPPWKVFMFPLLTSTIDLVFPWLCGTSSHNL